MAIIGALVVLGQRPTPAGGMLCSDPVGLIAISPDYGDGEGGNYGTDGLGESCADVARPRAAVAVGVLAFAAVTTVVIYRPRKVP